MTDPDSSSSAEPPPKGRGVLSLFNIFRKGEPEPVDVGDPAAAAAAGELVSHAREFKDVRVDDCMTPRADIVAIDQGAGFAEVVARFVEAEHSRMPVYRETLD